MYFCRDLYLYRLLGSGRQLRLFIWGHAGITNLIPYLGRYSA